MAAGSRASVLSGANFGLSLVLGVNQDNYMNGGQTKQVGLTYVVSPLQCNLV